MEQNTLYPSLNQSGEDDLLFQPLSATIKQENSDTPYSNTEELQIGEFSGIDLNAEPGEHKPEINTIVREEFPKIEATSEKHSEMFNQEKDLPHPDDRVQSPIEAADSLTSQWMEYAKEQQSIWKSSKDQIPSGGQVFQPWIRVVVVYGIKYYVL